MKKGLFFCIVGAILLASCANDDLVVKPDVGFESNHPISFAMKIGNQSRSDVGLETVMDNFAVWAFKGKADASDLKGLSSVTDFAESSMTVIPNYRVNFLKTPNYGSYWSYVTADWTPTPAYNQYLKYWDGSVANTYFFAYGPDWRERGGSTPDVKLAFDATDVKATMSFPALVASSSSGMNFIYSDARIEDNSQHVTAGQTNPEPVNAGVSNSTVDPLKVPLHFNRIPSQVKIAIYEEIPGYKVEMKDLDLTEGDASDEGAAGSYHVAAIPAKYDPDNADATKIWQRGSYLAQGTPQVVYTTTTNPYDKATLSFTEGMMGKANLNFALPTTNLDADGNIGETYKTRSFSPTVYNVMPNGGTSIASNLTMAEGETWAANDGLQFVMNFQLKSVDTQEVINVKGARCFVTPEYTRWKPNTVYTYVFKITKKASGTTKNEDVPNTPEQPEDALYPIIFAGVEIVDADTNETEWLVNGVEFSASSITLAPGATTNNTFGYTFDGTNLTWDVTTVKGAPTTSVVSTLTPYSFTNSSGYLITYPGTATITAGDKPGLATIKATNVNGAFATIDVLVTNGVDILSPATSLKVGGANFDIVYVSSGAVTWSTSDSAVATVDDGVVTPVGVGTATITATLSGSSPEITSTLEVTVTTP